MILNRLKKFYKKSHFIPTPISIFINQAYLIRKNLYKHIINNSHYMRGYLLDFGCGTKPYKELFKVKKYIGVDIKQVDDKYLDEKVDVLYDGNALPFKDESFDSIFSSEVFEHIFEIDNTLNELNRILKKASYMLITLPFTYEEHEMPYDFARYTSFGIKFILEKHGFNIIKLDKSTDYIQTIIQMSNIYLCEHAFPKNRVLRKLLTLLIIFPLNVVGSLFSLIFPHDYNLYSTNIVVAQKMDD